MFSLEKFKKYVGQREYSILEEYHSWSKSGSTIRYTLICYEDGQWLWKTYDDDLEYLEIKGNEWLNGLNIDQVITKALYIKEGKPDDNWDQ